MNTLSTSDLLIISITALVLFLFIAYFFLRWIFSVDKQVKSQARIEKILGLIAMKLGVPENDIPVPPVDKAWKPD